MRNGVAETLTFSFWERARLPRFANLAPSPGALLIRRGFAAPKRAGLSQRERYQNRSFSANWICREVVDVAVIWPAELLTL